MNAKFFRQRYDVLATFQSLNRHSTNSFGYRPFRLFATCSSFPCKVCHFRLSQNRGSVRGWGPGASCFYSRRSNQLSYAPRLDPAHEVDEARVSCAADCNENLEKESR